MDLLPLAAANRDHLTQVRRAWTLQQMGHIGGRCQRGPRMHCAQLLPRSSWLAAGRWPSCATKSCYHQCMIFDDALPPNHVATLVQYALMDVSLCHQNACYPLADGLPPTL